MISIDKRRLLILLTVPVLLLVPLLAMQFTEEVAWSGFDFLVMGVLLAGVGFIMDLVFRKVQDRQNRLLLILAVILAVVLIWAELAVGIFGTPLAGS
jgi:ABC-type cobalt transport system substrate-binding protein